MLMADLGDSVSRPEPVEAWQIDTTLHRISKMLNRTGSGLTVKDPPTIDWLIERGMDGCANIVRANIELLDLGE